MLFHLPFFAQRASSNPCWVVGVALAGLSSSALAAAADVPGLVYRPAIGCPTREVFAEELLRRMSFRAPSPDKTLQASIEYVDGAYLGSVALADVESTAARQVRNDSCDQVVQALALMGALLLDDEQHAVEQPPASIQEQPATRAPARTKIEQSTTTTPPSSQASNPVSRQRPINSFTIGPWGALLSDGLVTPEFVRFGWRGGAMLTLHQLIPGFQEVLRLSLARVQSEPIVRSRTREAELTWTSVRIDACHGWSAQELSTVAACALLDVGQYSGVGRVNGNSYEDRAILGRAGAAAYLRKQIWTGLALHADVGVMMPFKRPGFYFGAGAGLPSEAIFQVRQLGLVADVGLEMHFW